MKTFARRLASSLKTPRASRRPNITDGAGQPRSPSFHSRFSVRNISSDSNSSPKPRTFPVKSVAVSYLAASLVGVSAFAWSFNAYAEAPVAAEGPRKIRLSEVHAHGRDSDRYWIIRDDRVYDITEWVPVHPGGEVILRGVGGVVDPYWKIFTIHQKQDVIDILEQYFIGVVDPQDLIEGKVPQDAIDDPFQHDPVRDGRLRQITDRPCNAETPATELSDYLTPNNLFYVRNHMWVPEDGEDKHTLTVELSDGTEVTYTMDELRKKFKEHTITAVLQCSGNRRSHMTQASRKTNGLQWDIGAIGNAEWTGIKLRDVLQDAGLDVNDPDEDAKHAQFLGSEGYGASIPIDKAIDRKGDVLLAYSMNGEPLPRDHGWPLRVMVPGNVAARSVKWVNRITISDEESPSQWQRRDYKCFGPNEGSKPDWDKAQSIQEMPVQSAITSLKDVNCLGPMNPEDRKMLEVFGLEEDCVKLEGYAFTGGGRKIVRVDISADNGHTWSQAELLDHTEAKGSKHWGWQRWRFGISQRDVGRWFLVKATDCSYNTQPENFDAHYNYRGNLAIGWHRVSYPLSD